MPFATLQQKVSCLGRSFPPHPWRRIGSFYTSALPSALATFARSNLFGARVGSEPATRGNHSPKRALSWWKSPTASQKPSWLRQYSPNCHQCLLSAPIIGHKCSMRRECPRRMLRCSRRTYRCSTILLESAQTIGQLDKGREKGRESTYLIVRV